MLLEPDWDATLQLCDAIRGGEVTPKYAANALTKKVLDKNTHVSLYALFVVESCIKNCGGKFHEEILTPQFMENLHDLAKKSELAITGKICALIQAWDRAFTGSVKFRAVREMYVTMKAQGFTFPDSMKESDYMFVSECAPEWSEAKYCYRCRTDFSTFTRQHHCRHCGESFCSKCSSKVSTIPKFGIEKEVRVCDSCYDALNKGTVASNKSTSASNMPSTKSSVRSEEEDPVLKEYFNSALAKEPQTPAPISRDDKLKEEEELQLALAISQSEAEVAKATGSSRKSSDKSGSPKVKTYAASGQQVSDPNADEMAKYMDRSYWEKKKQEQAMGAETGRIQTVPVESGGMHQMAPQQVNPVMNGFVPESGSGETCAQIQQKLEMFLNRMRSNMARGRSISQDSAVQSAFQELSNLQPVLAKLIRANEMRRNHFESQQDMLSLMKDTRETLDSMRDDYQEKLRQEKLEKERQMMLQRQQKMEALRGLKQQFLLHRMQQLESQRQNQANLPDMQIYPQQPMQYGQPGQPPSMGLPPQMYMQQAGVPGNMQQPNPSVPMDYNAVNPGYPPQMPYSNTPPSSIPHNAAMTGMQPYNMQQMHASLPSQNYIPGQGQPSAYPANAVNPAVVQNYASMTPHVPTGTLGQGYTNMDTSKHMPVPPPPNQHLHQGYDTQSNASFNSGAVQSLQSAQYPPMMQAQPSFNQTQGVMSQGAAQGQPSVNSSMSSEQSQQHAGPPMGNAPVQETPLIDFG